MNEPPGPLREFRTASDERAGPGNEARQNALCASDHVTETMIRRKIIAVPVRSSIICTYTLLTLYRPQQIIAILREWPHRKCGSGLDDM